MYIMVKQLSKAKPTKKRHNANFQKLSASTVATPARNPVTFAPTSAGILPYLSAIHPKIRPPKIAPTKKTLWAVVGSALFSHTHPSCNQRSNYSWIRSRASFISSTSRVCRTQRPRARAGAAAKFFQRFTDRSRQIYPLNFLGVCAN